jgi:hypothetical protein
MNHETDIDSENLFLKLQAISSATQEAVVVCQRDVIALLALLRQLEQLHREVRDGVFQESLPDNRQMLYALLRNIESEGGWPYIERMRVRELLTKIIASGEFILDDQLSPKFIDSLGDNFPEW